MEQEMYNYEQVMEELKKNKGIPEEFTTETQLWDEAMKMMAFKMPELFLPLIKEVHGKEYPKGVTINPLATEYIVERGLDKNISSIRADITIIVNAEDIYHFECQIKKDGTMTLRMIEYDINIALTYSYTDDTDILHLKFPNSAVIYLQGKNKLPDTHTIVLDFQDGSSHKYEIPTIKVQALTMKDIKEKHLCLLIPFLPLRFRSKKTNNGELSVFFDDIIVLLDEEVRAGYLTEDYRGMILELLGKSMIRVFYKNDSLVKEVIKMTAPTWKLDRDIFKEKVTEEVTNKVTEEVTQKITERDINILVDLYKNGSLDKNVLYNTLKEKYSMNEEEIDNLIA